MSRIAVLGSGAWGTAIALSLTRRGGHEVTLWTHAQEICDDIVARGENVDFLPGFPLPEEIRITADTREAVSEAEIVVSVVPSEFLRQTYRRIAPSLHAGQLLVSATKGVEDVTFLRMTEVIRATLAEQGLKLACGVLSGPTFAAEVAAGFPTAITIAFDNMAHAIRIQNEFSSPTLRLYTNDDVIGVELGGAIKNVIAIACGTVAGLGLGYNSAAALITRGMAEITRLAVACGARRETLAGLSGIGDLVLTCTGSLSRNRTVGFELGKGHKLPEILARLEGKVAEGVHTTTAALGLAQRHGVEMPITEQMDLILHQGKSPLEAMHELMSRPGRDE
ncbi:MAG TPA: NAD(P)H-dependent glycerol-3-phosphate dehydrogenase [Acidisarcina sp.]|nr:NAD(P)H-dependent glycerol-3-phosphate dehydrogenase [Acidisarcina sp.]